MSPWNRSGRRPNILIIMTDQQRSEQHFPAGWAAQHLPWMTHLQETGVTFRRALCSSTACSPSRSAAFTSTYPTINGVMKVGDTLNLSRTLPMGGSLTTLGQVMAGAGYQMVYKGKWHLDSSFDAFAQMRPADKDRMMVEDDAMENHYSMPSWTSPDLGTAESGGTDPVQPGDTSTLNSIGGGNVDNDRRIVHGPLYEESQKTATGFLHDYDPHNEPPFCLVVSMANPHDVWVSPYSLETAGYTEPVWLGADYEDFQLPNSYNSSLSGKPTAQQDFLANFQGGPLDESDALAYVKFYAYLQTLVDGLTGDLLTALRNNSHVGQELEQDTIIVRLSDHGEMAMAQAGMRQKENNCYAESIHVPVIFSNPSLPQGAVSDSLIGLIDLLPTFAEIASDRPLNDTWSVQGSSFAGAILDPTAEVRDRQLFATDDGSLSNYTSIRALVKSDLKYAVYYKAAYDSQTDPTVNANGFLKNQKRTPVQYELYDYLESGGRDETDNLLAEPSSISAELRQRWQALHVELTGLMKESYTEPEDWCESDPPPADLKS